MLLPVPQEVELQVVEELQVLEEVPVPEVVQVLEVPVELQVLDVPGELQVPQDLPEVEYVVGGGGGLPLHGSYALKNGRHRHPQQGALVQHLWTV